jgi:glycine cleavage system H protein
MVAIFVLAVFFLILSVDLIVLKYQGKSHPAFEPSLPQYDLVLFNGTSSSIPHNIFLSKGHTWLKKNTDGLIEVGIDAFGTTALGKLSVLKCARIGTQLKRGDVMFEGAYGNKIVKFLSPVNGMVKSINTSLVENKISNPYETWGVRLISKDFAQSREQFLSGTEASNWMKKEFIKLRNFIDNHTPNVELAGATMYDGGVLSDDIASSLVEQSANDFEKEFLSL